MRAIGGIGSTRHAITRSAHGTLLRYLTAAGVVLGWLGLAVLDAVLSLIFWTEPNPAILIYTAPVLAVVPWILKMPRPRARWSSTPTTSRSGTVAFSSVRSSSSARR
jgi:hypothetical protein